jgi:hypothetical protein
MILIGIPAIHKINALPMIRSPLLVGIAVTYCKLNNYTPGDLRPVIVLTTNKTRKTTNNIQAMFVAVPAIPLSPSTPAISATTRNVTAQLNIIHLLCW